MRKAITFNHTGGGTTLSWTPVEDIVIAAIAAVAAATAAGIISTNPSLTVTTAIATSEVRDSEMVGMWRTTANTVQLITDLAFPVPAGVVIYSAVITAACFVTVYLDTVS